MHEIWSIKCWKFQEILLLLYLFWFNKLILTTCKLNSQIYYITVIDLLNQNHQFSILQKSLHTAIAS